MNESLAQLFDDLEREARQRAYGLEWGLGKLPAGFTERHYPLTTRERAQLRHMKACMALADSPDTYLALLRGGKVPKRWYERRLRQLTGGA